ncbi:MAG: UDP-N-acetylmuramoyl-L-alanyl-D-glutamate--2,6-diaminopimelate ligase [Solirubrobacteraceae bacterium]
MTLRELMGVGAPDVEITGLAYDSRSVHPGTLFFCVTGLSRDGHLFAPDAVVAGAAALVVERPLELGVPEVVVPSARAAMAPVAARFFGDPTAELEVVGVTGTNGKTTTTFLIRSLLEAAGRPCGLLGTVTAVVGGVKRMVVRTTPEAIDLQRAFGAMLEAGDRACAMEVSSHALELHRADAIHWAAAVFTNLTQDHLDFHATMEDYFLAKRRLFLAAPRASIINVDDPYGRRLADEVPGALRFAIEQPADYRAAAVETDWTGARFRLQGPDVELDLRSPLPGGFNVYNVMGAAIAALVLGVEADAIPAAVAGARRIPGRFEPVDEGQGFAVLVDYAHTPDSLDSVLRAARQLAEGRLVVVFGCGGDRDRGKRPLMGEIAARLADLAIVTSDNPRSEDPEAIIAEVLAGAGRGAEAIVDRRAAITSAIELAAPGDVVVIAGKGHEQGQEFAAGQTLPFDDVTVAREALRGAALSR